MDILSSLLSQNLSNRNDFEKVLWLAKLMKWIQRPRSSDEKDTQRERVYTVRLKYILMLLQKNPEWQIRFVETISTLLLRISSVSQFVNSGLPTSASFTQEFFFRLQEKVLPKSPLSEDLGTLIHEIFPNEEESHIVDFIDEEVMAEVMYLFDEQKDLHLRLKTDILSACYTLSVQILNTSFAIQDELRALHTKTTELYEFKLEGLLREHQQKGSFLISSEARVFLQEIEKHTNTLYELMHSRGVKVELVYMFQNQRRRIDRLRMLLNFFFADTSHALDLRYFISYLILDTHYKKSLRSFFAENLSLITERIVQANSHVGEHYVAFDQLQVRKMFSSAMGGGAVTAVTVFIKFLVSKLHFVGLMKGLVEGLNYSCSFLLIQILGWTLATKQPSATAPFIASALSKSTTESRRSIVALLRAQFVAVVGNLSLVFPICFLVSWALLSADAPILNHDEAKYVFFSTSLLGPSPVFAMFTGFLLFFASLIAGWFENWVIINRIPKRIRYNEKWIRWLGASRAQRFADFVSENSNGLAANISLGFLLGVAPPFLQFLGFPLEARHVTLSTGGFAASLPMMISEVSAWDIVNSFVGILAIGAINIATSFALALILASASSKIRLGTFGKVIKWGVRLVLTRPWLLFVPEKSQGDAQRS